MDIKPDRPVPNIEQIVLEAFAQAGVTTQAVDLCPPGHPRLHLLTEHVPASILTKTVDQFWALWARPYECHITLEHIEELRQLIKAGFS